jgi:hypothetical protein
MTPVSFERFAGWSAILVAIGGIAYSILFFVAITADSSKALDISWLVLMVGSIVALSVPLALYARLRDVDAGFASLGALLGVAGALGSAMHAGHDLAIAIKLPAGTVPDQAASATDPRGLSTFVLTGLGVMLMSWVMARGRQFPSRLGYMGMLLGILLVVVYLGRLLVFNPKNPFLVLVTVLAGFVLNPAWFAWVGMILLGREPKRLRTVGQG